MAGVKLFDGHIVQSDTISSSTGGSRKPNSRPRFVQSHGPKVCRKSKVKKKSKSNDIPTDSGSRQWIASQRGSVLNQWNVSDMNSAIVYIFVSELAQSRRFRLSKISRVIWAI